MELKNFFRQNIVSKKLSTFPHYLYLNISTYPQIVHNLWITDSFSRIFVENGATLHMFRMRITHIPVFVDYSDSFRQNTYSQSYSQNVDKPVSLKFHPFYYMIVT